jgi:hypothetical protein
MDLMLTQEQLKEVLDYNPDTGVFIWKIRPCRNVFAGDVAGRVDNNGYRRIGIDKHVYAAHRLACLYMMGEMPEYEIDHENHDRDCNVWLNLQPATRAINAKNRSLNANNKSGCSGVIWSVRTNKWIVRFKHKGKSVYLGYHADLDLAIKICRSEYLRLGFHENHGVAA